MKNITVTAQLDQLPEIYKRVEEELKKENFEKERQFEIMLAVEEIYVNIVKYAYKEKIGTVRINYGFCQAEQGFIIEFLDEGIPYNPLTEKKPNINLEIKERKIGGLGIYLVKELMDKLEYSYQNKKNRLKLYKKR